MKLEFKKSFECGDNIEVVWGDQSETNYGWFGSYLSDYVLVFLHDSGRETYKQFIDYDSDVTIRKLDG